MHQKVPGLCRLAGFLVLTLTALIGPRQADATGIYYQFDTPFPNDSPADGNAPWVTAYFANVPSNSEEVVLSITNTATGGDFIAGQGSGAAAGGLYFNVISALDVSNLDFTVVSGSSYDPSVSLSQAQEGNGNGNNGGFGFKADGDGFYDIAIDFGNNLGSGESIQFDITDSSGLTANDFEGLSTAGGGEGEYNAAAHIMGTTLGGGSTWVEPTLGPQTIPTMPVPEPSLSAIVAIGFGLLGAARLWRYWAGI